jgi:hypothetical protein
MEVLFAGICLWEGRSNAPSRLGLMPNARNGGSHGGHTIPPHTACVIARKGEVDDSQWSGPPQTVTLDGGPHFLYELTGDDISFVPTPNGGAIAISSLPKLGCATGKVVAPALTGASPSSTKLSARIQMPAGAPLIVVPNRHNAQVARLTVVDGTQLVSKPFGGAERRLKFIGANTTVIVANFDLATALGTGPLNPDDEHAHLYCPLFVDENAPELAEGEIIDATPPPTPQAILLQLGERLGDQLTIGAGCSNSQWP